MDNSQKFSMNDNNADLDFINGNALPEMENDTARDVVEVDELSKSFAQNGNEDGEFRSERFSFSSISRFKKRASESSIGPKWESSTLGIEPEDICSEPSIESDAIENRDVIRSLFRTPSYWISCSYRYDYRTRLLEITIRQTGNQPKIMAENGFRRLSMELKLDTRWKRNITLIGSRTDRRFVSSYLVIKDVPRVKMNGMTLKMKIFSHVGLMTKECLCKWAIPLEFCYYIEQTEFMKCQF